MQCHHIYKVKHGERFFLLMSKHLHSSQVDCTESCIGVSGAYDPFSTESSSKINQFESSREILEWHLLCW